MIIEFENEDIENLIHHKYTGVYKKYKSAAKLIKDLDKVIKYLKMATDTNVLHRINSLHYEKLTNSIYSSVRVGYDTKYRLIFLEDGDKITIQLIQLSEHYGDH
jgi:plasmid maintenance system killer protein